MKNNLLITCLLLVFLSATLTSCEAIAGIFKAGVWVGALLVIGIIALIIFIASRMSNKD